MNDDIAYSKKEFGVIPSKPWPRPKGKNFSANNLGQRKKSDLYETPYSLTRLMLGREQFRGRIHEPAAGHGAILTVLWNQGYRKISGYDLLLDGQDFLVDFAQRDNIITNPPFSLAFEFIQHAKKVTKRKIAFLLPLSYLHGKQRFDEIYQDKKFPLARVYVFTRYPMLGETLRGDGMHNTGMMVYAWFIWDKKHRGEPVIRWLDNNEFILRKSEK